MNFSIYTAFPRGYCAWVHRAVGMLMEIVASYPPPIYVNHEIIHNTFVVRMFERKGVIFEPDIAKIPVGSLVVISAHGTWPSYFAQLQSLGMRWIDATCPLVEKVHREARDYIARGYHILYIGKRWHQEAVGVIDEWSEHFTLIESIEDVDRYLPNNKDQKSEMGVRGEGTVWAMMKNSKLTSKANSERVWLPLETFDTFGHKSMELDSENWGNTIQYALLTQTTLSIDDTARIIDRVIERVPDIVLPKAGDICYATTNRQKAVKALSEKVDIVLVVGSKNSSNSSKLRHVAEDSWKIAYLIDGAWDIEQNWFDNCASVGVTAGASGPEELIEWVIEHLQSLGGKFETELRVVEERIEFPYTLTIHS